MLIDQPAVQIEENRYEQKETVSLLLYYRSSCFFCKKVFNYLKSIKKTIPIKNLDGNRDALEELIEIGGKGQVPCLLINEVAHYESNWIIEWLKENQDLY